MTRNCNFRPVVRVTKTPCEVTISPRKKCAPLILESLTAITAAAILSASGVPTLVAGNVILVLGLRQPVLIEMGWIDWTVLLLLDFLCIFTTWTYVTVRGGQLGRASYLALAGGIFPIIFLGNAARIAVEIIVASTSNAHSAMDPSVAASMDGVGLGVLFGFALLTTCASCLLLTTVLKDHVHPFGSSGFFGKKGF